MPKPTIKKGEVFQGEDFQFLDRVVARDQTALTIAEVSSFDLRVYESNDDRSGKLLVDGALPDDYFYDTLQTGGAWDRDSTGYNFAYTLEYDAFKAYGGRKYRFEFRFYTVDEGDLYSIWEVTYLPVMSR